MSPFAVLVETPAGWKPLPSKPSGSLDRSCFTMCASASRWPATLIFAVYDVPLSHAFVMYGSSGTRPKNGTLNFWAIASAPP